MITNLFFSTRSFAFLTCLTVSCFFSKESLEAARTFGGLQVSQVCRVHDGDTFIANIHDVHPLIGSQISIRIAKIDTPEITDKREEIKFLAIQARDYVINKLAHAKTIELVNMQRDKYFRILADVSVDGIDLANDLVAQGFAKPYDGGKKPQWP